jgi:hypothetical protein
VRDIDAGGPGNQESDDFPPNLGQAARRALGAAGYARLDQLAEVTDAELLALHGMGPKALARLRQVIAGRREAFVDRD